MKPLRASLVIIATAFGLLAGRAAEIPGLRPEHPRLLATKADWSQLAQRLKAEPGLAAYHEALLAAARQELDKPPARYEKTGRRLLGISRAVLQRVVLLAYAWRTTGDERFARRAEVELLAVAAFPDWNPSHFLDVGEATAAFALGYDWLFEVLTPAARHTIRQAIVEKGLTPFDHASGWPKTENNWNQVCFGGLTLGALAVADEAPAVAAKILNAAHAGIHHGLAPYAPDGVYPEGPSYWAYGTSYQVLMIAALESALGTDWNLAASPGFLASAGAYLQCTGPTGRHFNYSDGSESAAFEPAVFWFARKLGDPGLLL
ncbi:MAG: heparinase, partial [bacterium]|nr:heparinase [bacterium]